MEPEFKGCSTVEKGLYGVVCVVGRENLGFESFTLDSMSLAKPTA